MDKQQELEKKFGGCLLALNGLEYLWSEREPVELWWDDFRSVFSATGARTTYRGLFGAAPFRYVWNIRPISSRLKRGQWPRRWFGPMEQRYGLPRDVVLMPRRKGAILLSAQNRTALKVLDSSRKEQVEGEITAWSIAKAAGIERHVPTVERFGSTPERTWALLELALNTRPVTGLLARSWLRWLRDRILPVMERFYEASDPEIYDVDGLLEKEKKRICGIGTPSEVWKIVRRVEDLRPLGGATGVRAMIHADIAPQHVHRDGVQWSLIDWALCTRAKFGTIIFYDISGGRSP